MDVSGRLCFLEVALSEHINELLEEGHRRLVLNLVDVPYIDSFGLGQLISIRTSIGSRGGQLVLLRPIDHVQKLLQLTKLDSIFITSVVEAQAVSSAQTDFAAIQQESAI